MKVALLGTAPGSRSVAPFDDSEWEIWGCSQGNMNALPRITKWFELHPAQTLIGPEHKAWGASYLEWLKTRPFPVYMQEKTDHVPQAIVFPFRKLVDLFGRNWWTSSIAWMMGYAITQMRQGDTIGLFGIDMAAGEEHYTAQRAGLYRFIEIARERGINVTTPFESCLGQPAPMYGYSEATRMGRRLNFRKVEMEQLLANLKADLARIGREIAYTEGAIENNNYMLRTFLNGEDADIDAPAEPAKIQAQRPATTGDFAADPARGGLHVPAHLLNGHGSDDAAREE